MKNMVLKKLLFLVFILSGSVMMAQSVTGIVSEANGPLPGVNVSVKGTTQGATTDFDGKYTIDNISSDAILVFSYLSFKTQEIKYTGQATINVVLQPDSQSLQEVVIIGYGSTTKKDATGAVDAVSAKDFNKGSMVSPEQLLQGKSAGVQVTQSSGEPGAGINIRIRGTSSVRSNNNPLFVVDGVPLPGGGSSARGADIGFGSSAAKNPLDFLNPNDIKSISILKDASATAIYGSRGANGVIIITTKDGKGKIGNQFEFSSNLSFATAANSYDLLNGPDFLAAVTQFGGDASAQDFSDTPLWQLVDTNPENHYTDWQDVVTRNAVSTDQNLSYSKSYKNGALRASVGYGNIQGVLEKSNLERLTGRLNINHRLFKDKLKLNLQLTVSKVNNEAPGISDNAGFQGDLLGAAYAANPTWPTHLDFNPGGSNLSPSQMLAWIQSKTETNRVLANFSVIYAITDDLNAKVTLGNDNSLSTRGSAVSGLITGFTNGTGGNGRGSINDVDLNNQLMEATLNYKKEFANSKLTALVGYSYQEFNSKGTNISGWGFGTNNLDDMVSDLSSSSDAIRNSITGSFQQFGYDTDGLFITRLFPTVTTDNMAAPSGLNVNAIAADTYKNTDELQSFFGRVNYSIKDKYLFTATLRADGSSKFGGNNQYGYFPSAAFAWNISDEDFISDNISTLKLRLGWGITGNQDGVGYGNFIRRERFGGISIDNGGNINPPGTNTVAFANPDLKWEQTDQINIGVDFGFNNDRLNGTIDYYYKDTNNFLLQNEAAQPSPQPFFFTNVNADIINQGVELSLNYDVIQQDDITWNVGFNIAYNDNMVKNFDGQIPFGQIFGQGLSGAYAQLLAEGQPLFSFYLRDFQGYDANGQQIGDVQKFVGKSALPDINLGISSSFKYKNWDASVSLTGQYGGYIYNNTANAFFTAGSIGNARNVTYNVLTSGEASNNAPDVSTRFLESGDFLRLQNLTIGYNFKLKESSALKSVRLSVTGQNLFVITPYSGLDPEVNTSNTLNNVPSLGVDYTSYPTPRTFTFGLIVSF
ncbi:SusC/RagA family TonB-linked outer membrane protein [Lutibacter sp.]|uniref:SusC/RagA family TonB-linked outer membrane protein n=1 Tax=Lutibacter sp. TaxID=1925666 RepID=UPI0025BA4748|nr:SusC/RagA family TonB-linked outer membrane protein [Lutibacter sp.]MCF6180903.1 SusC/RagA family TonB-linked outer membrane protein [Lutibacter sp.]